MKKELKTHSKSAMKNEDSLTIKVYSNKELRHILGVDDRLIRRYRDSGLLGYSRVKDKFWYTQKDVEDFLDATHVATFRRI